MMIHYHLDGINAHPGESCRWCKDLNRVYLFNVMTTEEVIAKNEEEAYDKLNDRNSTTKDRDVMLVEVVSLYREKSK